MNGSRVYNRMPRVLCKNGAPALHTRIRDVRSRRPFDVRCIVLALRFEFCFLIINRGWISSLTRYFSFSLFGFWWTQLLLRPRKWNDIAALIELSRRNWFIAREALGDENQIELASIPDETFGVLHTLLVIFAPEFLAVQGYEFWVQSWDRLENISQFYFQKVLNNSYFMTINIKDSVVAQCNTLC